MQHHRIIELIELLLPEWKKSSDMSLIEFVILLAKEAKFEGDLESLTDDTLIYHLKMRNKPDNEMIPGLAKDQVDDFKTALLKARGII